VDPYRNYTGLCYNQSMTSVQDMLNTKVQDLPEPQRSTIIAGMTQLVLLKLVEQLTEKLSSTDQLELEGMIDRQASEKEIFDFLKTKFPDLEARAEQIAAKERIQLDEKLKQLLELIHKDQP